MDYLRPAKLDDVLEVETVCSEIGGASLTLTQEVKRGDTVLVRAKVVVVLISAAGKPQRIGKMIREALADYTRS
ncbi:Acyl-CoA thioester hydrolase YbgC [Methyloligella halotolerans]|uniref:Acyl-CoA thioester hydrolase YbgC n=1 Tax=Methyloligella halotolerans TaxID=1177755 RepID=A0A1E2RZN5_9HYPH|nr:Acyl-CoA thioester hydrolase YbgC [Methyloligella halotolerans]